MIKLWLTTNSTILMPLVFFMSHYYESIDFFNNQYLVLCEWLSIITVVPFIMTGISVILINKMENDSIKSVTEMQQENHVFLPIYLGYCFVGLAVTSLPVMVIVYAIILMLLCYTNTLQFNPFLLMMGYDFYNVTTEVGVKIFVMSKQKIKNKNTAQFDELRRIDDYTYVDVSKND